MMTALALSGTLQCDLVVTRGDDGGLRVNITDGAGSPLDMALAVWRAHIRNAAGILVGAFGVTVEGLGVILLSLTADLTAALPDGSEWDLEMTMNSWTTTLLTGKIRVLNDVSRLGEPFPPVPP